MGEPDREKLVALYERFGFRGMREALLKGEGGEGGPSSPALLSQAEKGGSAPSPLGEGSG